MPTPAEKDIENIIAQAMQMFTTNLERKKFKKKTKGGKTSDRPKQQETASLPKRKASNQPLPQQGDVPHKPTRAALTPQAPTTLPFHQPQPSQRERQGHGRKPLHEPKHLSQSVSPAVPSASKRPTPPQHKRSIPAAVKRRVAERDRFSCTFVSARGKRCGSKSNLEYHHRTPFAMGGEHTYGNITLHCRAHNQFQAHTDYGPEFMQRVASSKGCVSPGSKEVNPRAKGIYP